MEEMFPVRVYNSNLILHKNKQRYKVRPVFTEYRLNQIKWKITVAVESVTLITAFKFPNDLNTQRIRKYYFQPSKKPNFINFKGWSTILGKFLKKISVEYFLILKGSVKRSF